MFCELGHKGHDNFERGGGHGVFPDVEGSTVLGQLSARGALR